jgi:3-hydroxybutyryl-CoA dehydrogenase
MEQIKKVAVLGSGVMGIDIALLFATNNFPVLLWHRTDQSIARNRLEARIQKYREKDILSEEQAGTARKITKTTQHLKELADCDLVVESIVEDRFEKSKTLKQIADVAPGAILTTNTSSLSINELAAGLPVASRFAGLHFFNPVLRIELVEIVANSHTSNKVIHVLAQVCAKLGKTAVAVKDSPGFIVNRLMACQVCQAIRMLEEGVASAQDIDTAVKLGLLHPVGPLALADLIGLDVVLNILSNIFEKTGDDSFRPPERLKQLVNSGSLGRKTGSGLYAQYK